MKTNTQFVCSLLRPTNQFYPKLINPIPSSTSDDITCNGDAFTPSTGQHILLYFCFCTNSQGNNALLLFPISLPKSETNIQNYILGKVNCCTTFFFLFKLGHKKVSDCQRKTISSEINALFNMEKNSNFTRTITWQKKS